MKKTKRCVLVLLLVGSVVLGFIWSFLLQGMGVVENKENELVSSATVYDLTEDQLKKLSIEAKEGNKDSAFRLSQYYEFSEENEEKFLYWLEISAKQGHYLAQYNMAFVMAQKNRISDAMYWVEIVKKNGQIEVDSLINEINRKNGK